MPTALVTGAAGFIAGHLTRTLVERGYHVKALDDLSGGTWETLDDLGDRITRLTASVTDAHAVRAAAEGADVIFHHAALVSVPQSVERPLEYNNVCVGGTLNVLEAARAAGVPRVVYASSSACYGENPVQPKVEAMRAEPISPYAVAKYAGELYVSAYAGLHGMKTVSLRYFNVFGPGQNPRSQYGAAIPSILSRMLRGERPTVYGDGRQTRDFCYIENVVKANLLAASADVAGEALNIGCGRRTSVNDIVAKANALLGKDLEPDYQPARPGDVRDSLADIALAEQVIGYRPSVYFDEGLERSIRWYEANLS